MPNEVDEIEVLQSDINKKRKNAELRSMGDVLQQALEPTEEQIEELNTNLTNLLTFINKKPESTKEPDYFDPELTKKVTDGIDNVKLLIQKLKPLDLSPIKEIADSVNSRNAELIKSLTTLANLKNDTSGYDNLFKQVMLMIQKNNEFLSAGIKQADYSLILDKINSTLESGKPTSWELKTKKSQYGETLTTATPIFKTDKK